VVCINSATAPALGVCLYDSVCVCVFVFVFVCVSCYLWDSVRERNGKREEVFV